MKKRQITASTVLKSALAVAALAGIVGCVVRVGPEYGYHRRYYGDPYYAPAPPPPAVYVPPPAPVVVAEPVPVAAPQADPALQQLVAPIALYPDPLIADILPAATYPDQVQQANQWVAANPGAPQEAIDAQNWAPSVKAMVHYPTVLNYMASQPGWTSSLGSAFSENQANVFEAIQDLRLQARNSGNLNSTVYMDVIPDGATIAIQPADPAVIYVPAYDPVLVYRGPYVITYGPRFVTGPWLVGGVDWYGGIIFVGDWRGGWLWGPGGWHRDYYFHAYDHRWVRDDHWGPRPFVDRAHWAFRPEVGAHGGFHPVVRAPERMSQIHAQNQRAQTHNEAMRGRRPEDERH